MTVIIMTVGAVIVNLLLVIGLLLLPPVGIKTAGNIFALIWLTFGVVVNIAFIRGTGIFRWGKKKAERKKLKQY